MSLPLKLDGFERYMWMDDQPSHPMAFLAGVRFSGTLDPAAFRAAVAAAIGRHPLLRARIEESPSGGRTWVDAPDPMPYLDMAPEGVPMRFPGQERIDLRTENGLRIWVRTGPDRALVYLQVHHTACDGVGLNQFLEDLLLAYDRQIRGDAAAPPLPPRDPQLLERRAQFGLRWWEKLLRIPVDTWGFIVGFLTFFLGRPAPIAAPDTPQLDEDQLRIVPELLVHDFQPGQLERLLTVARRSRATLNDLLFRDVFLALYDWNQEHAGQTRRRSLRIMLPMNLRGPHDAAMPAANVVGMVFLDRAPRWLKDPDWLLWSIRMETRFLKFFRFGVSFAWVSGALTHGPKFVQDILRAPRCYSTCTLSNVGKTFHQVPLPRSNGKLVAGGLTMESVFGAPPVRLFTSASMVFSSYAGRLTLSMHYDRRRLTAQSARALLDAILRQLQQTCQQPDQGPPK